MDVDLADFIVDFALQQGCGYAEARLEQTESNAYLLKNSVPQVSGFDETTGLGFRFLHKGALGFFATSRLDKKHLKEQVLLAVKKTKAAYPLANKVNFAKEKAYRKTYHVKPKIPSSRVSPEEKLDELMRIDKALVASKSEVASRFFQLTDVLKTKYITTSDGTRITSTIPRISCFYMLTVQDGQRSNQRYWEHANVGGFEHLRRWDLAVKLTNEAEAMRHNLLTGKKAPTQKVDLVLGPEIAGIIAHEACGHPTEADRILGREAAQAGGSFITQAMLNTRIGSPAVSVIDDPAIEGSYGYFLFDDEGVKAQKKFLYKDGMINAFLHNKETAAIMDTRSNGCSRASAYDREPLLRMSNTYIKPGNHSQEELFEGIRLGVYMRNFTEWNIGDTRYHQKYVGAECYLIRNGRLTDEAIRIPALEITTPELYGSIDACGKDLELHPGNCGKGEPMQGMPVTMGGPHIRVRDVRLN